MARTPLASGDEDSGGVFSCLITQKDAICAIASAILKKMEFSEIWRRLPEWYSRVSGAMLPWDRRQSRTWCVHDRGQKKPRRGEKRGDQLFYRIFVLYFIESGCAKRLGVRNISGFETMVHIISNRRWFQHRQDGRQGGASRPFQFLFSKRFWLTVGMLFILGYYFFSNQPVL